ncbi:MAG: flagellar basal body P-ring protein FlgI [Myxococcales bacterium]|nr:MAG: flagellar basal body P-ring protein FlgI [Myxococcales bacterium]
MRARIAATVLIVLALLIAAGSAEAARLKDITHVQGVRDNQIIGYGLVVGLNKTGDDQKVRYTIQSLTSMLSRMGIRVDPADIRANNVAAVMVTADLAPFAGVGARTDVLVSSIGNAKSLQGGTLLMTPLRGADGRIYAMAQGPLLLGGYSFAGESGTSIQKNHPTAGRVPEGAIIEREISFAINARSDVVLSLIYQDFTTASRIAESVNASLSGDYARARDAGAVVVRVPDAYQDRVTELLAHLEAVTVQTDRRAKVVLNERTGTVVMGADVRISTVAISHGSLKVHISNRYEVSQPNPLAQGETVVVPETAIKAVEDNKRLMVIQEGATIGDVVMALNAIGVSSRDLIDILQAIRASGALEADMEVL